MQAPLDDEPWGRALAGQTPVLEVPSSVCRVHTKWGVPGRIVVGLWGGGGGGLCCIRHSKSPSLPVWPNNCRCYLATNRKPCNSEDPRGSCASAVLRRGCRRSSLWFASLCFGCLLRSGSGCVPGLLASGYVASVEALRENWEGTPATSWLFCDGRRVSFSRDGRWCLPHQQSARIVNRFTRPGQMTCTPSCHLIIRCTAWRHLQAQSECAPPEPDCCYTKPPALRAPGSCPGSLAPFAGPGLPLGGNWRDAGWRRDRKPEWCADGSRLVCFLLAFMFARKTPPLCVCVSRVAVACSGGGGLTRGR